MNRLKKIAKHISDNIAEYYTLLVIVLAIPVTVGMLTSFVWAALLSFIAQAIIGILFIKGSNK